MKALWKSMFAILSSVFLFGAVIQNLYQPGFMTAELDEQLDEAVVREPSY